MSDVKDVDRTEYIDKTEVVLPIDKTVVVSKTPPPEPVSSSEKTLHADAESRANPHRSMPIGVGSTLKDRFYLEAVLGVGGMGTVYKAKDLRQEEVGEKDPWLAIKILNENISQHAFSWGALQRECKKTQQLSHPNIVSVFDFDRDGDTLFMSMELLDGIPLDEVINAPSFSGWSEDKIDTLVSQVGGALAYAHSRGIVHSDLKPSNIFMTKEGDFKVYDFGIARAVHDVSSGDSEKSDPLVALTPAYASLGMLREEKASPVDDLYAFGCVVHIAYTSEHPYRRKTALEAFNAGMDLAPFSFSLTGKTTVLSRILSVRTPTELTVEEFVESFLADASQPPWAKIVGGTIAIVLLVLLGIYLSGYQDRERLHQLKSEDRSVFTVAFSSLSLMERSARFRFLESVSGELIEHFLTAARLRYDAEDFRGALIIVRDAVVLYPDSKRIAALQTSLQSAQEDFITDLRARSTRIQMAEVLEIENLAREIPLLLHSTTLVEEGATLWLEWEFDLWLAQKMSQYLYLGDNKKVEALLGIAHKVFPEDKRFGDIADRAQAQADQLSQEESVELANTEIAEVAELWEVYNRLNLTKEKEGSQTLEAFTLLHAPELHDGVWGRAIAGGVQSFVTREYSGYRSMTSSDAKKAARRYRDFGNTLYPSEELFRKTHQRIDPCKSWWAGKGKRERYRCKDSITSTFFGQELVIIPSTSGIKRFAIMRHEVSNELYRRYCQLYKRCRPSKSDATLPLSGISTQESTRMAQWLTSMTGYIYRLPTYREWKHAIGTENATQINDHNCLLSHGNKIIRGKRLRSIDKGSENRWGIKNGLGNVSEWVIDGGRTIAVGGGANTPLSDCHVAYRSHEAEAVGLRLVRELK